MKKKQVFKVMNGENLITTVKADNCFSALRKFRTCMRNTWASTNSKTLKIIPISDEGEKK